MSEDDENNGSPKTKILTWLGGSAGAAGFLLWLMLDGYSQYIHTNGFHNGFYTPPDAAVAIMTTAIGVSIHSAKKRKE